MTYLAKNKNVLKCSQWPLKPSPNIIEGAKNIIYSAATPYITSHGIACLVTLQAAYKRRGKHKSVVKFSVTFYFKNDGLCSGIIRWTASEKRLKSSVIHYQCLHVTAIVAYVYHAFSCIPGYDNTCWIKLSVVFLLSLFYHHSSFTAFAVQS